MDVWSRRWRWVTKLKRIFHLSFAKNVGGGETRRNICICSNSARRENVKCVGIRKNWKSPFFSFPAFPSLPCEKDLLSCEFRTAASGGVEVERKPTHAKTGEVECLSRTWNAVTVCPTPNVLDGELCSICGILARGNGIATRARNYQTVHT